MRVGEWTHEERSSELINLHSFTEEEGANGEGLLFNDFLQQDYVLAFEVAYEGRNFLEGLGADLAVFGGYFIRAALTDKEITKIGLHGRQEN